MNSFLTKDLNPQQEKSVLLNTSTNALILAGAGSGKTSVLTKRIAYLINNNEIDINNILALTFTNKAAGEMRERLSGLLRTSINQSSWVGTFHSLAHKILRLHFQEAGLTKSFQIIDTSDQTRIIKRILKDLSIDDKKLPPRDFINFISKRKDEGLRYHQVDAGGNFAVKKMLEVFKIYEEHCRAESLVDFAEILLRSFELLQNNQTILQNYQQQFKHILVDEFQDTNSIQYNFIKLLKTKDNSIFCVGDDDQSIYGWRGAKIENINNLAVDFAPLEVVKLEQNYRSTGNILDASNSLIANNDNRMNKSLWTDSGKGELIDILVAENEKEEANYIAKTILENVQKGIKLNQNAILYRSNALSRAIEESLMRNNIDYIIYGGLRFFDRAEIKDALHYLRLIENFDDNIAFERIVNFPTRGIGIATIESIRSFADMNFTSLFVSAKEIMPTLSTRANNALGVFIELIENLKAETKELSLSEKIDKIIHQSTLLAHFEKEKGGKGAAKVQNLKELVGAAKEFKNEDITIDDTSAFIASSMLDVGEQKTNDSVQLMTIHSAKGLEFDNVFIIGLEEDIFPTRQSKEEPRLMDEERRLCYVAMTRAKIKLTMSLVKKRFLYGNFIHSIVSRFLNEVPKQYMNRVDVGYTNAGNYTNNNAKSHTLKSKHKLDLSPNGEYAIGTKVVHKKFGLGSVVNYEGGENGRVEVAFQKFGTKWLILEYANLEKLL